MSTEIDLYSPRRMMQALIVAKRPRTFLRSTLVRREEYSVTEFIDADVQIGVRRMAPFVNPNIAGKSVARLGYSTKTYKPPMVAPKRPLTVTDLQKRMPGESPYSTQTPEERAAALLGQDLADLDEQITRREEWMIAQMAFTSSIPIIGDDVNETISFDRSGAMTVGLLAAGDQWDQNTAAIAASIRQWIRLFVKQNGIQPSGLLVGEDVADMLTHAPSLTGLTGLLNTRRLDMGLIKPEDRGDGVTYYGQFSGTNVDIWGYDEWYVDPSDGVEKPMVPAKSVLMYSDRSYVTMNYGAVGISSGFDQQAQLTLVAGARVPDSWVDKEPPVRWLKVNARPLPTPVQNDAFLTAQVIA